MRSCRARLYQPTPRPVPPAERAGGPGNWLRRICTTVLDDLARAYLTRRITVPTEADESTLPEPASQPGHDAE